MQVGKSKHMNSETHLAKDHLETDNKQVLCSSEFTQDCASTYIENECLGNDFISDEPRFLKKPKSQYDESNFESDMSHGIARRFIFYNFIVLNFLFPITTNGLYAD